MKLLHHDRPVVTPDDLARDTPRSPSEDRDRSSKGGDRRAAYAFASGVWWAVAALLVVALVGAMWLNAVANDAARDRRDANLAHDLRNQLMDVSLLEWQTIASGAISTDIRSRLDLALRDIDNMVAQLHSGSHEVSGVVDPFTSYEQGVKQEFGLLGEGDVGGALRIDHELVDPAFNQTRTALDSTILHLDHDAAGGERDLRVMAVMAFLFFIACFIAIIQRASRSRLRLELAVERQKMTAQSEEQLALLVHKLQQRLAGLFESMRRVEIERTLPVMLQGVVEAACVLTGARYGALGVLDDEGKVVRLLTYGLEPGEIAAIGEMPKGHGVIGRLITDPRPLRIDDLGTDPTSFGFPEGHPPMRSFLGVPIRARDRILGNFYLTDKTDGQTFTGEDEELVSALAAWAGTTIENEGLYEETRERERWLDAYRQVTTVLLQGADVDDILSLVAERSRVLANADLALISVPAARAGTLVIAAADGLHADEVRGTELPVDESMSGEAMRLGEPVMVDDASLDERAYQPVVVAGEIGPSMFVPIKTNAGVIGTIAVSNRPGGRRFTDDEARLIETFADQAALAVEYGRVQRELNRLVLLEDRERIAHDLHDTVIQRLFATGIALQATARLVHTPTAVAGRLEQAVDDLDVTIREIRSTIFSLTPVNRQGRGLRADVLALAGEAAGSLGFDPRVRFEGLVDAEVPDRAAEHLLPTLREALSNVARHARANFAEVLLAVDTDVMLRVTDDGVGLPRSAPRHGLGLGNMADRAEKLGGSLELRDAPGGGTVLEWRVPRVGSEGSLDQSTSLV